MKLRALTRFAAVFLAIAPASAQSSHTVTKDDFER